MTPSTPILEAEPAPNLALVDVVHDLFSATFLRVQPTLAEEGITKVQFWALHTISKLGAAPLGTVARYLGVSPPTVCTNIDMLEAEGLVRRARTEKDHRTVELSLTPRGRRVEARIRRDIARLMSEAVVGIPERDLLVAVRVFRAITEGLRPAATARRRAP